MKGCALLISYSKPKTKRVNKSTLNRLIKSGVMQALPDVSYHPISPNHQSCKLQNPFH
jgi:hypothetical protein